VGLNDTSIEFNDFLFLVPLRNVTWIFCAKVQQYNTLNEVKNNFPWRLHFRTITSFRTLKQFSSPYKKMSQSPAIHIRPQHLFDIESFARYLQDHVSELVTEVDDKKIGNQSIRSYGVALKSISQFADGQSNPSFKVVIEIVHKGSQKGLIKEMVLRKKPAGKLLPSAHDIYREYAIMKSLHSVQFPVPYMFLYCKDEKVIGTEFYLMEFLHGRIFKDGTFSDMHKSSQELQSSEEMKGPEKLKPSDRSEMMTDFVRTLAKLHTVDYKQFDLLKSLFAPKSGQSSPTSENNTYYDRQIATWTRQYLSSETHEIESMNRLIKWLPQNIPQETRTDKLTIVHGDFKFDNVIFHPTENRVIAVLDWELCTLGHPISDLAYSSMYYHFPRIPGFSGLKGVNFAKTGVLTEAQCVELYRKFTSTPPINKWHFYLAFSMFRLSGIAQGVYKRYKQGNASSGYALQVGLLTSTFSDIAWDLVVTNESDNLTVTPQGIQFGLSTNALRLKTKLEKFMNEHVYPAESVFVRQQMQFKDKWAEVPQVIEELKEKAKKQGLWNFFLVEHNEIEKINNVEYAVLAEIMGRSFIASEGT